MVSVVPGYNIGDDPYSMEDEYGVPTDDNINSSEWTWFDGGNTTVEVAINPGTTSTGPIGFLHKSYNEYPSGTPVYLDANGKATFQVYKVKFEPIKFDGPTYKEAFIPFGPPSIKELERMPITELVKHPYYLKKLEKHANV